MQIDFHHGVTYVLSRLAGFDKSESHIIACSSQYVDDSVFGGKLLFTEREAYKFIASAHKMLDYRNYKELGNQDVWIPFHFLPGNSYDPNLATSEFVQRLICRPNSEPAKDLCEHIIKTKDKNIFSLHSLGVCMHVYADTWAHQGFAGINHDVNKVNKIYDSNEKYHHELNDHVDKFYKRGKHAHFAKKCSKVVGADFLWNKIKSHFISDFSPIGHGPVLSFPDLPYLSWMYSDYKDEIIIRDNPSNYMDAVDHLFDFLCRYRGNTNNSLKDVDRKRIEECIRNIQNDTGEIRLLSWWRHIEDGYFSFGAEKCEYFEAGERSWLNEALGIKSYKELESYQKLNFFDKILPDSLRDPSDQTFENLIFKKDFFKSEWKMAQDALHFHRFSILHKILPKYELCVV